MKIFILGATGQTGLILTKRLLEADHHVKAYVRNPEKISYKRSNLIVEDGEIADIKKLTNSMKGYDIVVSCLGGNANKKDNRLTKLTANVVDAMKENDMDRLVAISSAGIENELPGLISKIFVALLYRNAINDHKGAAAYIKDNIKNYTLIRPLSLIDGEETGIYRVASEGVPKGSSKISRNDLSHFMFDVIVKEKYFGESISPAY